LYSLPSSRDAQRKKKRKTGGGFLRETGLLPLHLLRVGAFKSDLNKNTKGGKKEVGGKTASHKGTYNEA